MIEGLNITTQHAFLSSDNQHMNASNRVQRSSTFVRAFPARYSAFPGWWMSWGRASRLDGASRQRGPELTWSDQSARDIVRLVSTNFIV